MHCDMGSKEFHFPPDEMGKIGRNESAHFSLGGKIHLGIVCSSFKFYAIVNAKGFPTMLGKLKQQNQNSTGFFCLCKYVRGN